MSRKETMADKWPTNGTRDATRGAIKHDLAYHATERDFQTVVSQV